jgi:hypothetical protein
MTLFYYISWTFVFPNLDLIFLKSHKLHKHLLFTFGKLICHLITYTDS